MISKTFHRRLGMRYEDAELLYYGLDNTKVSQALPSFRDFHGAYYGPSGKEAQEIINIAGRSDLTV
jgi:hypothetical protein